MGMGGGGGGGGARQCDRNEVTNTLPLASQRLTTVPTIRFLAGRERTAAIVFFLFFHKSGESKRILETRA